jgi:tRNA A-37 threonylcarbamoyl transferase component Bud32
MSAKFNDSEIYMLKNIFNSICDDNNIITREQFLKIVSFGGILGERIFYIISNHTNKITYNDFVNNLQTLGKNNEKCYKLLFDIFNIEETYFVSGSNINILLKYNVNIILDETLLFNYNEFVLWIQTNNICEFIRSHIPFEPHANLTTSTKSNKKLQIKKIDYLPNNFDKTKIVEDYLYKQTKIFKYIKKIYCLLGGNCLYIYKSVYDNLPKKVIVLTGLVVTKTNFNKIYDILHIGSYKLYIEINKSNRWLELLQYASNVIPLKDKYTICELIGKGAFSEVYRCIHNRTNKSFAIKIMNKNNLINLNSYDNVKEELHILNILKLGNHPNIITIKDIYEDDINVYVITEYIESGDLLEIVIGKPRLSEQNIIKILKQMLNSLEYLHNFGYIHRDIKLENILSDLDYNIKLTDFGLSKNLFTEDITLMSGTLPYVAPEIISGKKQTGLIDVWSLGICMHILYKGNSPFEVNANTDEEILHNILNKELVFELNNPIDFLLDKMLKKNPKERISVNEAIQYLNKQSY